MARKSVAVVGIASLLVGVGVAIAAPAVAVSFGPELPLSPVSQQNAVRSAQEYIEISSFSRSGLIEQLIFEGFSTADATYAVDSITVDWNVQAARSAKEYLEISSFSRIGLVEQLVFEGFTPAQAQYGVATTGL